jgi:imidazolonepropionase
MVGKTKLIGPFKEIITLRNLSLYGSLTDDQLEIITQGGVLVADGKIVEVGNFESLRIENKNIEVEEITSPMVLMPGMVDAHTHICYGGSRANDYALRIAGKSYLDIAKSGGGILSTVKHTREASETELIDSLKQRCNILLEKGVTTCEVKSGYGLSLDSELKMLQVINKVNTDHEINLIPTCLAAHTKAPEFDSIADYAIYVSKEILPEVVKQGLAKRADIFVEESAFGIPEAREYLQTAKSLGFDITVHADQFTAMGSSLAAEFKAVSADHLEASTEKEIKILSKAKVPGILLPGASMGLGLPYAKGRMMLDKGMCIAIASDWNPGSAPMGDLLMQAAVFGAYEKLTTAETLAAITYRAAHTLNLLDRGRIEVGSKAHLIAFPTHTYKDILYYQGSMKPVKVWC